MWFSRYNDNPRRARFDEELRKEFGKVEVTKVVRLKNRFVTIFR